MKDFKKPKNKNESTSVKKEIKEIQKSKERISDTVVEEYIKMKKEIDERVSPGNFQAKHTLLELITMEFLEDYEDGDLYLFETLVEIIKKHKK